jgi:hypothetical protein
MDDLTFNDDVDEMDDAADAAGSHPHHFGDSDEPYFQDEQDASEHLHGATDDIARRFVQDGEQPLDQHLSFDVAGQSQTQDWPGLQGPGQEAEAQDNGHTLSEFPKGDWPNVSAESDSEDAQQDEDDSLGTPYHPAMTPYATHPYDGASQQWAPHYETWTPAEFNGIGDPFGSQFAHHYQGMESSCGVMAELEVFQSITGHNVPADQGLNLAKALGLYHDGTSAKDMGQLLNYYGVQTEQRYDATLQDIAQALQRGDRVIAGVNATEVRTPLRNIFTGEPRQQAGGGHALWITGLDPQPDGTWKVIVCDSAYQQGGMMAIDAADFLNAWADHNNFLLIAHPPWTAAAPAPTF